MAESAETISLDDTFIDLSFDNDAASLAFDIENIGDNSLKVKRNDRFCNSFFEQLCHHKENDRLTDFTIVVGDKTIRCHKVVLAAACPYFDSMFSSGMAETKSNEVQFPNLEFGVINSIVLYFYSGEITLKWDIMKSLVEAIDFLQLQDLKEIAEEFIPDHITPESCLGWYKFAEKFALEDVAQHSKDIVHEKFEQVYVTEEFVSLELSELIDCIQDEDIEQTNDDCLLKAVFLWSTHEEERKLHLGNLLSHVDLKNCSASAFSDIITKYREVLCEVERDIERQIYEASLNVHNRKSRKSVLVISGRSVSRLSIINPKASLDQVMTIPIANHKNCQSVFPTTNGFGVCGGGHDAEHLCSSMELYSWEGKWTDGQSLPTPLRWAAGVILNKKLYLFGGRKCESISEQYIFDFETQSWTKSTMPFKPNMPLAITVSSHSVYILSRSQSKSVMYLHNVKTTTWGLEIKLPVDNAKRCSGTAVEDRLFLCGGVLENTLCYDVPMRSWTTFTQAPIPSAYGAAVYFERRIWLFGGECTDIQIYDPETDSWEVSDLKLPNAVRFVAAFVEITEQ